MISQPVASCLAVVLMLASLSAGHTEDNHGHAHSDGVIKACATTTELASLLKLVGQDHVAITVFVEGPQNPHTIEPTPSDIRALHKADLLVRVGLHLEEPWLPSLLRAAKNPKVAKGKPGYFDASEGVRAILGPAHDHGHGHDDHHDEDEGEDGHHDEGKKDKHAHHDEGKDKEKHGHHDDDDHGDESKSRIGLGQEGSYHPEENPHYLLDPIEGMRVAHMLADRLGELRPSRRSFFHNNAQKVSQRLWISLVGKRMFDAHSNELDELTLAFEKDGAVAFLTKHKWKTPLGGWLGRMQPHHGEAVVGDHDLWPYLARLLGLEIVAYMEAKPGVPPTPQQLGEFVREIKTRDIKILLTTPYYDPKYAAFVSARADIKVLPTAHQVASRPGTDDYFKMVAHNIELVLGALEK